MVQGDFVSAGPGTVIAVPGGGPSLVVPGGAFLFTATFERQGDDLLLTDPSGTTLLLTGYFAAEPPPALVTESGKMLPPDLVEALAGPATPGQYAQLDGAIEAVPIGLITESSGVVHATRADGTEVELVQDSPVFQGDVVTTGEDAAVAITFIDETVFSLGASGRMVLDAFVFDPTTLDGESTVSILQGVFVFVSGEIAANNPDDMIVRTPVATIGVRGTRAGGMGAEEGEWNTVVILPEQALADDAGTQSSGALTVQTFAGAQDGAPPIILDEPYEAARVASVFDRPLQFQMDPADAVGAFGAVAEALRGTPILDDIRSQIDATENGLEGWRASHADPEANWDGLGFEVGRPVAAGAPGADADTGLDINALVSSLQASGASPRAIAEALARVIEQSGETRITVNGESLSADQIVAQLESAVTSDDGALADALIGAIADAVADTVDGAEDTLAARLAEVAPAGGTGPGGSDAGGAGLGDAAFDPDFTGGIVGGLVGGLGFGEGIGAGVTPGVAGALASGVGPTFGSGAPGAPGDVDSGNDFLDQIADLVDDLGGELGGGGIAVLPGVGVAFEAALDPFQDGNDLAPGNAVGTLSAAPLETMQALVAIISDGTGAVSGVAAGNSGGAPVAGSVGVPVAGAFGVLQVAAAGNFIYTLTDPANHGAGAVVSDVFTFTATDAAGNAATELITIAILDDAPVAAPDSDQIIANIGDTAGGNVLLDQIDVPGADGPLAVAGVAAGATGVPLDNAATVGAPIAGAFGDLVVLADGIYEYTVTAAAIPSLATDVFTYTARDGDGSLAQTTLTLEFPAAVNNVPTAGPVVGQVAEAGLDTQQDGLDLAASLITGSDPGTTQETLADAIAFASVDPAEIVGVQAGDSGGADVVGNVGVAVAGAFGLLEVAADGSFVYTLTARADHGAGPASDIFTFTVGDIDGDTATNTVTIAIVDDTALARDDADTVDNLLGAVESGNVITAVGTESGANGADVPGADGDPAGAGTLAIAGVAAGDTGAVLDNPLTVGVPIAGAFGDLNLNAGGGYDYTVTDAAAPAGGQDVFTYTLRDDDGSLSAATLTVTLASGNPTITLAFEGAITFIGADVDDGNFAIGQPITGEYTYELVNAFSGTAQDLSFAFGPYVGEDDGPSGIGQTDDAGGGAGGDLYIYRNAPATGPDVNGFPLDTFSLQLRDPTGTAFSGNNLLLDPTIGAFEQNGGNTTFLILQFQGPAGTLGQVRGTITALDAIDTGGVPFAGAVGAIVSEAALDLVQDGSDLGISLSVGTAAADTTETVQGVLNVASADPFLVTGVAVGDTLGAAVDGDVGVTLAGAFGLIEISEGGSFVYTLTDAGAHDGGALTDIFTYTVTDDNGDQATSTLTVSIEDDAPIARADTDDVLGDLGAVESGNVITGDATTSGAAGADTPGADGQVGAAANLFVAGVAAGDTGAVLDDPGTVGAVIPGAFGDLVLNADGGYDYRVTDGAAPGGSTDTFTYTLDDGDGSRVSTTLTLSLIAAAATPLVTFTFSGVIQQSLGDVDDGTFKFDDVISGQYSFDPTTADANPTVGNGFYDGAIADLSVSFGSSYDATGRADPGRIVVNDDLGDDAYIVFDQVDGPDVNGTPIISFGLNLVGLNTSALQSEAPTVTPPDLSQFGNDLVLTLDFDDAIGLGADVLGTINTLALAPGDGGANVLFGSVFDDALSGAGNDDILAGGGGGDLLDGGADEDIVIGDGAFVDGSQVSGIPLPFIDVPGADNLTGGAGDDRIFGDFFDAVDDVNIDDDNPELVALLNGAVEAGGDDTIGGGDGTDLILGGGGNDEIAGGANGPTGIEQLFGGFGNDSITGNDGSDLISGGFGADDLTGGAGDDVIIGGPGLDAFNGRDLLTGGPGADAFVYFDVLDGTPAVDGQIGQINGDLITDFEEGVDRIRILELEPDVGQVEGLFTDGVDFFAIDNYDGTNALAAPDTSYFVYDSVSDTLYFDEDVTINGYVTAATFQNGAAITSADIETVFTGNLTSPIV